MDSKEKVQQMISMCLYETNQKWVPGTLPWIVDNDKPLIKSMRSIGSRIDTTSLAKPMQAISIINTLLQVYKSQLFEAMAKYQEHRDDMSLQLRKIFE